MPALKLDAPDRASTPISRLDWALPAAISSAISRPSQRLSEATGSRGGRHPRLRRQQPPPARLGDCACSTARCLLASRDALIGILGLAYKENTHSTKNSPVARADLHARDRGGSSSTTLWFRPRPPTHPRAEGRIERARGRRGCRRARHHDAMAGFPRPQAGRSRARHGGTDRARSLSCARRSRRCRSRARLFHPRGARHIAPRSIMMLEHSANGGPSRSRRVVVIGAGGFVGSAICTRLAADKVPLLAAHPQGTRPARARSGDEAAAHVADQTTAWCSSPRLRLRATTPC